jgi:hypothetical protein
MFVQPTKDKQRVSHATYDSSNQGVGLHPTKDSAMGHKVLPLTPLSLDRSRCWITNQSSYESLNLTTSTRSDHHGALYAK